MIPAAETPEKHDQAEKKKSNNPSELYELVRVTEPELDLSNSVVSTGIPEHQLVLLDPWWETEYMGVAVGVLVTVILILIAVILFIMYKNHMSSSQGSSSSSVPDRTYYQTYVHKAIGPPGLAAQWEDTLIMSSSPQRKLPPTPNSCEGEHYRDPSLDHSSSPLIRTSLRQQQQQGLQQHYAAGNWGSMFAPPPPPGTPPGGRAAVVVSHYAATDLMCGRGKLEKPQGGTQYFL